jgi:hypothetical protein
MQTLSDSTNLQILCCLMLLHTPYSTLMKQSQDLLAKYTLDNYYAKYALSIYYNNGSTHVPLYHYLM